MVLGLTQEGRHLLPRFGHVHLQDEVGVRAEAQQRTLLSSELQQLLQDLRVLLKTHRDDPQVSEGSDHTHRAHVVTQNLFIQSRDLHILLPVVVILLVCLNEAKMFRTNK